MWSKLVMDLDCPKQQTSIGDLGVIGILGEYVQNFYLSFHSST